MKKVLAALLALPLLGLPLVPGTASAEVMTFADTVGDSDSPTTDITAYVVDYDSQRLSIGIRLAEPNIQQLYYGVYIDTTGDGVEDFRIFTDGDVTDKDFRTVCEGAPGVRAGDRITLSAATSCLGDPEKLRVQITLSGAAGDDFAPGSQIFSPFVARTVASAPAPTPPAPPAVTPPPVATPSVPAAKPARSVTIGIRQASGVYTFSGEVGPVAAGVQVTLARLDGATKRVTGVASTKTDAAGRYRLSTRLPSGMAGFYALTAPTATHTAGRSRLYGLNVPASLPTARVTMRAYFSDIEGLHYFRGDVSPCNDGKAVRLFKVVGGVERLVATISGGYTYCAKAGPDDPQWGTWYSFGEPGTFTFVARTLTDSRSKAGGTRFTISVPRSQTNGTGRDQALQLG